MFNITRHPACLQCGCYRILTANVLHLLNTLNIKTEKCIKSTCTGTTLFEYVKLVTLYHQHEVIERILGFNDIR